MSHPAEPGLAIEVERTQFRSLLLQNPNYYFLYVSADAGVSRLRSSRART